MLAGDDLDIGRHAGQQPPQRILGVDHHRVGDHIVERGRRQPDLLDRALEGDVGIGIDIEADRIIAGDLADIGLVDLGIDLHLGEVLGDGEQLGRRHAGRDRLPGLYRALDHHAVDRRADIGAFEIDAGAVERGLALRQRGLGVVDLGLGDGEVGRGALLRRRRGVEHGLGADALSLTSSAARDRSSSALCRLASARWTLASWSATLAVAMARPASSSRTLVSKVDGSMRASTWPCFTSEEKSALSSPILPESCEPISTVPSARTVPEVETTRRTSPRVAAAVWMSSLAAERCCQ